MGKRVVIECDLCGKESELNHSIEIKHKKKKGRAYEICQDCAGDLEVRLVSSPKRPLTKSVAKTRELEPDRDDELKLDDGSTREIPTRAQLSVPTDETTEAFAQPLPEGIVDGERCIHMNKTSPRIGESGAVFQKCKDCGTPIPYKSARQKAAELNARLPSGTSVRDHPSEERKGR